jgi:hypothetical protein
MSNASEIEVYNLRFPELGAQSERLTQMLFTTFKQQDKQEFKM